MFSYGVIPDLFPHLRGSKTERVGTQGCSSENSNQVSAFLIHEVDSVLHAQRSTKIGLKRRWQRTPSAKSREIQKTMKKQLSEWTLATTNKSMTYY